MNEKMIEDLLHIPHKIQRHHDADELAPIVLHDLGHDNHFGFNRAIYLIDNPEFNCLKGVAGYCKDECALHHDNVWHSPHTFAHDMQNAHFHKATKDFSKNTCLGKHNDIDVDNPEDLIALGTQLGLKNPSFLTWKMRHGNHGILLFEEGHEICARRRDLLRHATALLSLC